MSTHAEAQGQRAFSQFANAAEHNPKLGYTQGVKFETPWSSEAAASLSTADAFQQAGQWNDAITHYRRALQLSPTPPSFQQYVIYNNLGWSSYHMGDWATAEEHYHLALKASPNPPPTDHAYINLATLHKAENRVKPTIKAYRAAVALTHQSPTWAQLGWALMQDFKLEEATQTLHDALAMRGDEAPAAQESHNYLGVLYAFKRTWSQASQHFVRAADLGLPADGTGCKAGRWTLSEGWTSGRGVTVHRLPLENVLAAVSNAEALAQSRTPRPATFSPPLCSREMAAGAFEDAFVGTNYTQTEGAGDEGALHKLVELRDVYLDGKHPSSLYQAAPECRYFTGEHSASGFLPWDFGVLDREQNGSYSKQQPSVVTERTLSAPTFGVFDLRGGSTAFWHYQIELVTRLALLLKAVVEPRWDADGELDELEWSQAQLFVPATLAPIVRVLADSSIFNRDPVVSRLLRDGHGLVTYSWQAGLRIHFKRLLLLDVAPPLHETGRPTHRMLKLNLRATRQKWRIYDTPLYNLHFPRRPGLLLQRCLLRAAMPPPASHGSWAEPRILYYSRGDGQSKRVVRGERKLIEKLREQFGRKSVQVFQGGTTPDPKRAARLFSKAVIVIGPHGAGLANLVYCEPTTAVFLMPTIDGVFNLGEAATRAAVGGGTEAAKLKGQSGRVLLSPDTDARDLPGGTEEGGGALLGAVEGSGISAFDAYFTYLASALNLQLFVLPFAKAHFWGNYSVPPYVVSQVVERVRHTVQSILLGSERITSLSAPALGEESARGKAPVGAAEGDVINLHVAGIDGPISMTKVRNQKPGGGWTYDFNEMIDILPNGKVLVYPPAPPAHPPRAVLATPHSELPPLPPPLRKASPPPPPLVSPTPKPKETPKPKPSTALPPSVPVFGSSDLGSAFGAFGGMFGGRGNRIVLPGADDDAAADGASSAPSAVVDAPPASPPSLAVPDAPPALSAPPKGRAAPSTPPPSTQRADGVPPAPPLPTPPLPPEQMATEATEQMDAQDAEELDALGDEDEDGGDDDDSDGGDDGHESDGSSVGDQSNDGVVGNVVARSGGGGVVGGGAIPTVVNGANGAPTYKSKVLSDRRPLNKKGAKAVDSLSAAEQMALIEEAKGWLKAAEAKAGVPPGRLGKDVPPPKPTPKPRQAPKPIVAPPPPPPPPSPPPPPPPAPPKLSQAEHLAADALASQLAPLLRRMTRDEKRVILDTLMPDKLLLLPDHPGQMDAKPEDILPASVLKNGGLGKQKTPMVDGKQNVVIDNSFSI